MSSMLALTISSSRIQSPSIPNVITEATESGSSNISSLFVDRFTDIVNDDGSTITSEAVNSSRY